LCWQISQNPLNFGGLNSFGFFSFQVNKGSFLSLIWNFFPHFWSLGFHIGGFLRKLNWGRNLGSFGRIFLLGHSFLWEFISVPGHFPSGAGKLGWNLFGVSQGLFLKASHFWPFFSLNFPSLGNFFYRVGFNPFHSSLGEFFFSFFSGPPGPSNCGALFGDFANLFPGALFLSRFFASPLSQGNFFKGAFFLGAL